MKKNFKAAAYNRVNTVGGAFEGDSLSGNFAWVEHQKLSNSATLNNNLTIIAP